MNLGSGFGGPARYLSATFGARVTAVELQDEVDRFARELTARCGLDAAVTHLCGDALAVTASLTPQSVSAFVSWLTLLHIPERTQLIQQVRSDGYLGSLNAALLLPLP